MKPVTAEILQDLEKFLEDAAMAWQKSHHSMDKMSVTIQATVRSEVSGEIFVSAGFTTKKRQWRLIRTKLTAKDVSELAELAKVSSRPKPWIATAIKHLTETGNNPAPRKQLFRDVHSYEPREAANLWLRTQGVPYRFTEIRAGNGGESLIQLGFGR